MSNICETELIQLLSPDKNGRYTGFWYADRKNMINQLYECQLEEDKVFYIHVKTCHKNTQEFIWQSPNSPAWEIFHSGLVTKLRYLDVCFSNLEVFIETIQYLNNDMHELHWVHANKMKYIKSKVCKDSENTNVNK